MYTYMYKYSRFSISLFCVSLFTLYIFLVSYCLAWRECASVMRYALDYVQLVNIQLVIGCCGLKLTTCVMCGSQLCTKCVMAVMIIRFAM